MPKKVPPLMLWEKKPAGISGSELDADKNQVDVEMDDSSVERSVVVGAVREPVRLGSKISRMNSKHLIRSIESNGKETKSDSDNISDEHNSSSSGDEQRHALLFGNSSSSSEDDGSSEDELLKTRATMLDARAARAGRCLNPADIHEVKVLGCGSRECNGIYRKIEKEFDGVPMYEKQTLINGEMDNLLLYRCQVPEIGRRWYISSTPNHVDPGTLYDEHYYTAPEASKASDLPPRGGWTAFYGQEPPPQVFPKSEEDKEDHPRRISTGEGRHYSNGSPSRRGKFVRQSTS